ncbi:hypothetical protein OH77DRAFT_1499682 [Trametes cingulata]|nr:hypothetical protein OH77DRAFT_1499682 [Trametes cingulata]
MARACGVCNRSFPTLRAFSQHRNHYHRRPKPPPPQSRFRYHPHLTADPCDAQGGPLQPGAQPAPQPNAHNWEPFSDRPTFEFAEHAFKKMENSEDDINHLLRIIAARDALHGHEDTPPFFDDAAELLEKIDRVPYGDIPWQSFAVCYTGPVDANSPAWKQQEYVIHTRNTLHVAEAMAGSADFRGKFDTVPYEEYVEASEGPTRRVCNLMSGQWAFTQADEISKDENTRGAMPVPILGGADKTTVSVQTGNQEFHPVYMSLGNIHNEMRRAHCDGVVPIAFLAIPKGEREATQDEEFRLFKKQLYHYALAHIFAPLRAGMTTPHVLRCPDGHYRRAIFELGPFIADYPEQVYLAGIVQGWCPKCLARPDELDKCGDPRFRELTDVLKARCNQQDLWDAFGIVRDVTPYTHYFPRADVHELLTPDLLHQLIKGTFKDHLIAWVEDYIRSTAETEADAKRILDDIDRRLAAVPTFPGLRRFPNGRNFKQWTGNDSKALMKVILPALVGYVPEKMIQCIAALLDFSYLARRSAHTMEDLKNMESTLARFHALRTVFVETEVRPDGFSLPRQHALLHYVRAIQLFGSPNGLCSSITESKHIVAVKRPWRRSNRKQALGQIIRTLTRLSKLAAARVEFACRGMLQMAGFHHGPDRERLEDDRFRQHAEVAAAADPRSTRSVLGLGQRAASPHRLQALAVKLRQPSLTAKLRQFLHDQLYPELDLAVDIPLNDCPVLLPRTRVMLFHSATATFYAPSKLAGVGGMHQEIIRCTPSWYGQHSCFDTVLVQTDTDAPGMLGMTVARVRAFLLFSYGYIRYQCALVEWFELVGDEPDAVTGMWMVKPELAHRERITRVIPLNSIVRACHLISVYGRTTIPKDFHFSDSLDAFRTFYVNWFADYHAHEDLLPVVSLGKREDCCELRDWYR